MSRIHSARICSSLREIMSAKSLIEGPFVISCGSDLELEDEPGRGPFRFYSKIRACGVKKRSDRKRLQRNIVVRRLLRTTLAEPAGGQRYLRPYKRTL